MGAFHRFATALLASPALIGLAFAVIGKLVATHPPKKISHSYGYRTPRSMRSQDTWDEANRYAPIVMIRVGLVCIIAGLAAAFFLTSLRTMAILTAVFLTGAAAILIISTERRLRALFDDKGNRR